MSDFYMDWTLIPCLAIVAVLWLYLKYRGI